MSPGRGEVEHKVSISPGPDILREKANPLSLRRTSLDLLEGGFIPPPCCRKSPQLFKGGCTSRGKKVVLTLRAAFPCLNINLVSEGKQEQKSADTAGRGYGVEGQRSSGCASEGARVLEVKRRIQQEMTSGRSLNHHKRGFPMCVRSTGLLSKRSVEKGGYAAFGKRASASKAWV